MREDLSAAEEAALAERQNVVRKFLTVWPRNRSTGLREAKGFWNGAVAVTVDVLDPATGALDERTFEAAGGQLLIPPIVLTADGAVRELRIRLSQVSAAFKDALITWDPHQAPMQVHLGMFDAATRDLLDAPKCEYDGFVDDIVYPRARAGEQKDVELVCRPLLSELTRSSADVCSHASQQRRTGENCPDGDDFFKFSGRRWTRYWGEEAPRQKGGAQP